MKNPIQLALIAVAAAGLALAPSISHAETAKEKKQIKKYLRQLKKLPNGAAPPAKVKRPALKLVKLDPRKAKRYYKLATLKYAQTFVERKAQFLANKYRVLLGKSDLAEGLTKRLQRQVTKIEKRVIQFNEPTPTPGPYQADHWCEASGLQVG